MALRPDRFMQQLLATFRVEAQEHLEALGQGLMAIEKTALAEARATLVEGIFRAAHSLKGAARAVELHEIETLCQSLEDRFAAWKSGGEAPSSAALDGAHRSVSALAAALDVKRFPAAEAPVARDRPPARPPESERTVRVPVSRLDARLASAEEMLAVRHNAAHRAAELQAASEWFDAWRLEWHSVGARVHGLRLERDSRRGGTGETDALGALIGFLDWNLDRVQALESRIVAMTAEARRDRRLVAQLVDDLLEESKQLLLSPFATITSSLPKMVRDLCQEQGKSAQLLVAGEDVRIDRRVLESMKDPLMHVLRNCVDHAIELPAERERAGKPERATIGVSVTRPDAGKVVLRVSDDGRGIDAALVRSAAVAQGLLSSTHAGALADRDAVDLIFRTGLSTSPVVTRLSGRGLGLAIVRDQAERVGGAVSVASTSPAGTTLEFVLPTMLATLRGILVECAGGAYLLPTAHVERVARVKPAQIRGIEGRDAVRLGERMVPLTSLAHVLELPDAPAAHDESLVLFVLGSGDGRVAFAVDAVLEELEVLVKPLRPPLNRVRNISGATVLPSGRLAPVLNAADLLKSARSRPAARRGVPGVGAAPRKAVLVAEDSITSRLLLKGILESAGYQVRTAADGLEAFALLRAGRFDAVVSDVDMPRLNGFGLAAKIRADRNLAQLPVVLVTTLASAQDRERGLDAGANAYIAKSGFDAGELLDALRRLA